MKKWIKNINAGNGVRQKAINLFYLIFLVLIFSFVPTEFVDSTFYANSSLDLVVNDLDRVSSRNNEMMLALLKDEPALHDRTSQQIVEINTLTAHTLEYIERIKRELIDLDEINEYGFLTNGRQEYTSRDVMVENKRADTLFIKLHALEETLADYLDPNEVGTLHQIFDLNEYILNSDGNYVDVVTFYFKRSPLNNTLLNLTHFKSKVERAKHYTQYQIIAAAIQQSSNSAHNAPDWLEGGTNNVISPPQNNDIPGVLNVTPPATTTSNVGDLLIYDIRFDASETKPVKVVIQGADQAAFTLREPGPFYLYTPVEGDYQISVIAGDRILQFKQHVVNSTDLINANKLPSMYIGMLNPIDLDVPSGIDPDALQVICSGGRVVKRNGQVAIDVEHKGVIQVKIFANLPYGRALIAQQSFTARDLNRPLARIQGQGKSPVYKRDQLSRARKLVLLNDEYLIGQDVNVLSFTFSKIFNDHGNVSAPVHNEGAQFNASVARAVSSAQPGDLLMFFDITVSMPDHSVINIPSLTVTVQ